LFIAAWFAIARLQFSERFAWWLAICLAITPIVWMTATKVLSDSLAAGLISVELVAALIYVANGQRAALLAAGLFGAAATGTRPQLIAVAVAIIVTALMKRRAEIKNALLGLGTFFFGCLLWFVPMCYLQTRAQAGAPDWLV